MQASRCFEFCVVSRKRGRLAKATLPRLADLRLDASVGLALQASRCFEFCVVSRKRGRLAKATLPRLADLSFEAW